MDLIESVNQKLETNLSQVRWTGNFFSMQQVGSQWRKTNWKRTQDANQNQKHSGYEAQNTIWEMGLPTVCFYIYIKLYGVANKRSREAGAQAGYDKMNTARFLWQFCTKYKWKTTYDLSNVWFYVNKDDELSANSILSLKTCEKPQYNYD